MTPTMKNKLERIFKKWNLLCAAVLLTYFCKLLYQCRPSFGFTVNLNRI